MIVENTGQGALQKRKSGAMNNQDNQGAERQMKLSIFPLFNANRSGRAFEEVMKELDVDIPIHMVPRFNVAWHALSNVLDANLPDEQYFLVVKFFVGALKQYSKKVENERANPSEALYDAMYGLDNSVNGELDELKSLAKDQAENERGLRRIDVEKACRKAQVERGHPTDGFFGDAALETARLAWLLRCDRNKELVKRCNLRLTFFMIVQKLKV